MQLGQGGCCPLVHYPEVQKLMLTCCLSAIDRRCLFSYFAATKTRVRMNGRAVHKDGPLHFVLLPTPGLLPLPKGLSVLLLLEKAVVL